MIVKLIGQIHFQNDASWILQTILIPSMSLYLQLTSFQGISLVANLQTALFQGYLNLDSGLHLPQI